MADAGGVNLHPIQIGAKAPCPLIANVDGNHTSLSTVLDAMQTEIDSCEACTISDIKYFGDPLLQGSWKIERIGTGADTSLFLYRKSADGIISANWVREGNLPREFGEMYRASTHTTTITTQNVWYKSLDLAAGDNYGMTFVEGAGGDNYLQIDVGHGGHYRLVGAASLSGATGKTYELVISINDIVNTKSISQRKMGSSDVGTMSGTAIVELAEGDKIRFVTRCIDAITDNATYQHSNINLARI